MEQIQNFGPNDVENGTLARMFRNAGINDVNTYVDDVRQENIDLQASSIFDKPVPKKSSLQNAKQIYQMVNKRKKPIKKFLFSFSYSINH